MICVWSQTALAARGGSDGPVPARVDERAAAVRRGWRRVRERAAGGRAARRARAAGRRAAGRRAAAARALAAPAAAPTHSL